MDIEKSLSPDLSIDGYFMVMREGRVAAIPTSRYQQGYLVYHRETHTFASLHVRGEADPVSAADRAKIWEVIKNNREAEGSVLFPAVRSIGVDDGFPYYISDFSAGTPLISYCEEQPAWPARLAAKAVLRFIEQVRRLVPVEHYCLLAESLWIVPQPGQEPGFSLDELYFHPHPEAERENASLAEWLLQRLTGSDEFPCGVRDLASLEKHLLAFLETQAGPEEKECVPPLVPLLHQWFPEIKKDCPFEDESPKARPSATALDLKSFLLDDRPGPAEAVSLPTATEAFPAQPGPADPTRPLPLKKLPTAADRSRIAWLTHCAAAGAILILGYWLFAGSRPETKPEDTVSAEKLPRARMVAPDRDAPVPAEIPENSSSALPETRSLPTAEQLAVALHQAALARKENRLVDAIWHEMEALQLAPDSPLIRQRIDGDLYQLQLSGEYRFSAAQMEVLYNAATLNPIAADIIVRFFRKSGSADSGKKEAAAKPPEQVADLIREADLIFDRPEATPEELKEAFLKCLAAAGNDHAEAVYRTGVCLIEGRGTAALPAQGILLLQKAVLSGYHPAMVALGKYYLEGRGVEKDERRAAMLFAEAIARGSASAYGELGALHAEGRGVEKNPAQAAALFEAGARKDDPACMMRLAQCLETGSGCEKNSAHSLYWIRKSAAKGFAEAIIWCEKRNISMTSNSWPRADP